MAQTLDQIIGELNNTYQPQINSIEARRAAIPGQLQAEEQGLQAKQESAFGSILDGARRRGTGVAFGGIPLADQAKYTATEFLPALARLKQSGREQQLSLEDALNQIYEKRNTFAYQIKQNNDQLDFSRQQFEYQKSKDAQDRLDALAAEANRLRAAAASSASSFSPTLGGGVASPSAKAPAAATKNFIGNNDLRGRLAFEASKGNRNAEVALKYVGNDGKFSLDPRSTSPALIQILQGLGATNVFKGPANGSAGSNVGIAGQKLNFGF